MVSRAQRQRLVIQQEVMQMMVHLPATNQEHLQALALKKVSQ